MAPFARPESFERILWDFSRENPWLIILFALTVLILPVQYVVMPYMYGQIIQSIEKRRPFLRPLVAVLAIILATQAVIMASEWQETTVYPRLQEFTRDRLLMRLIAAQSKDYYELETGRILSVLSKLPTAITQYIDVARNNVVPHLMVYIMVAAFLVTVDGCLAAALAFTGLSSWILAIWSPSLCAQASTRRDRSFNLVNEAVDDLLKNLMTVLNLDQVDSERRRLSDLMREYKAHSIRSMACYSAPRTVVVVIHIAFVAYYVQRAYRLYMGRAISSSAFVTLMLLVLNVLEAFSAMVSDVKDQTFRWGIIQESMRTFNDLTPQLRDALVDRGVGPRKVPHLKPGSQMPVLRLRDVVFRYPKATEDTVRHVDLDVHYGERVALVGTIGSGKSTIGKLIMRYHSASQGRYWLQGVPYEDMTPREVRSRVALVPQQPILFNRTVLENIRYGMPDIREERIAKMIDDLGLTQMFAAFPQGLHSPVGKGGSRLSGGQRQIVWILRCLLQEPVLLILDEPTSALDPRTKATAMRFFERISKGRTMLIITHDEEMMRFASRVVTLDRGRVVRPSAP